MFLAYLNMEDMDFYGLLGVDRDADSAEIRRAYKRAALAHHPDKAPADERAEAEVRFKAISEAYETLVDDQLRTQYDLYGQGKTSTWQDFYDDFEFFTEEPGQARGGRWKPDRTDDAIVDVDVPLEDIFRGRLLKLAATRRIVCTRCKGRGGHPRAQPKVCGSCNGSGTTRKLRPVSPGILTSDIVPCEACRGQGHIYRKRDQCKKCKGQCTTPERSILEVYIPKGAPDGHKVILEGKSDEAPGRKPGNIIIVVHTDADPVFRREQNDLYASASISLQESLCGFSRVLLTHLDGRGIRITVPRGVPTRPNQLLRVRGEGLGQGDLYIEVEVNYPERIDEDQLVALSELLPNTNSAPIPPHSEEFSAAAEFVDVDDLPTYETTSDSDPGARSCLLM